MRKLLGIAAVAATCSAPVVALPASASAQSLPSLPVPVPTDPSQLPPTPIPLPSLPPLPIPTDAIVNALGQVFDQAGNLLGVVDSVTGLLIPASPPETPSDTGSTPSGSPSGSTSSGSGGSVPTKQTPPPVAARPQGGGTNTAASRNDDDAPGLSLLVTHATSYRSARAKGLRVTARCTEACRLTLRLTKGAQYATLSKVLQANTTTTLNLKLNKGAKKVLATSRRATKLTLRGQAVDEAGNHSAIISRTTIVKAGRR